MSRFEEFLLQVWTLVERLEHHMKERRKDKARSRGGMSDVLPLFLLPPIFRLMVATRGHMPGISPPAVFITHDR